MQFVKVVDGGCRTPAPCQGFSDNEEAYLKEARYELATVPTEDEHDTMTSRRSPWYGLDAGKGFGIDERAVLRTTSSVG